MTRRMTRREVLRVAGLGSMVAFLAACQPKVVEKVVEKEVTKIVKEMVKETIIVEGTPQVVEKEVTRIIEVTAVPPAAAPAEKVELEWFTAFGAWGQPGLGAAVDNYMKLNPDVTFKPLIWGMDLTQGSVQAFLARVAADDAPDIALMWATPVALGAVGALTPLDELMAGSRYSQLADWPEVVFGSCQWRGKSYGFPSFNAIYCMYYLQELFEQEGIPAKREEFPATWDALREVSQKFTTYEGNKLTRMGYFPSWVVQAGELWMQLNGGAIYDSENEKYTFERDENVEMLEYGIKWIDEEYRGSYDDVMATGWDFWQDRGGEKAFQDGRMVIVLGGNFCFGGLHGEGSVPSQYRWELAKFPTGPSGKKQVARYVGNWTMIPTGAKHVKEAFDFLDWFNGDGVRYWCEAGSTDTPGSRKFDPGYLQPQVVAALGEDYARSWDAFYKGQLEASAGLFLSPISSFHRSELRRAVDVAFHKVATPAEALKEAQTACELELQRVLALA